MRADVAPTTLYEAILSSTTSGESHILKRSIRISTWEKAGDSTPLRETEGGKRRGIGRERGIGKQRAVQIWGHHGSLKAIQLSNPQLTPHSRREEGKEKKKAEKGGTTRGRHLEDEGGIAGISRQI